MRNRVRRTAEAARNIALATIVVSLLLSATAWAGEPEYMRLDPKVGVAVEATGEFAPETGFVVDELEELERPRRPKLRGILIEAAADGSQVVMFGMRIGVDDDTEFEGGSAGDLRPGIRAEVSCAVSDDTGEWTARSIRLEGVKSSDKIKGTITGLSVDGAAPDTLSISGLQLILVESTDFEHAALEIDGPQSILFGQLASPGAVRRPHAYRSGDGRSTVTMEYRQNLRAANQFDLSEQFDSDLDSTQPEIRGSWFGFWSKNVQTRVQARFRRKLVISSDEDLEESDFEAQISQMYVLVRDLFDDTLALQLGRQDFDEKREWLYDDYLDAARVLIFPRSDISAELALLHAVEPLNPKFETWTDLLVKSDWWWSKEQLVAAYGLRRWDSDETRKREPFWLGLRAMGEWRKDSDYWLDVAQLRGEDKHESLRAWAFDAGATLAFARVSLKPALTLAYAFGSGDETGSDAYEESFRQTGYQDNNARLGGRTAARYYGAVLDPELSNIAILTLGLAVHPLPKVSVELLYHRYEQDWADDRVRGDLSDPPARPNGQSTELGWGADLLFGLPKLWDRARSSVSFGIFEPGAAYAPRQERAFLVKLSLSVGIG